MIEWQANRFWYHLDSCHKFGIDIGLRMSVIRLNNGSLLIHNPCQLTESIKRYIEGLGEVSCITTANQDLHDDLSDWWLAFPDAYFYSAPGLAAKRTDIGFDGVLNSATSPRWKDQLFQTIIRGNEHREEVVFCDPVSHTLILGENVIALNEGSLARRMVGKLSGCETHPIVPFCQRLGVNDKQRLRQSLQEILTWPFEHILPIHGDPILFDGKKKLALAYAWALKH
ncbi:methanol oxidase [Enterovibrio nigricans]|uniref:Methanol oxidase n=1 Tax=Enterovibrio nigricans DSM 22720 TaxID=1121868 RepID=A0A1T4VGB4_9GAMM|nr:methanol oxidase [Enterovibrio nigricans]PKF49245.1 methanol oxidase [Enterovibrio nigricans]SKA64012.1 hypothetical protein SAMN02745132_03808 [Enterovibrio nigricans DSM 22720]